ncbi:dihydrolipoamide acetyltransferase family protein [Sphingorhabdus sp. Alg239-R122]|uniref:dihydrolipoamide acetyltransferase family protein n=1 Tax=Sphingorhabdus sp. Alg239-R122 TaxID=2305989 RepID=UPI0013DB861A|nr:dihydrolipoamide acetyltransferase family protein [Sphingorhabdus sp. Alg239-R122]
MGKYIFNLPDIGEGIAEAEIVAWHVKVGDMVEEDQQIADMMTDKATVEMEAPVDGKIVAVAGEEGDVIAIGSMLVEIETEGDDADGTEEKTPKKPATEVKETVPAKEDGAPEKLTAESTAAPEPAPVPSTAEPEAQETVSKPVKATPAVRARAKNLGVDLSQVKAQGEHIRHADLDAYLAYGSGQGYQPVGAWRKREDEKVKVIGLRRKIAENMAASKRNIPHFSYVDEIDVTALEDIRADLNASRGNRPKLTVLPLMIVAIARTIPDFPMINALYDDEAGHVTRHGAIHLGMATQTDSGLKVPVIKNAQDRNVWQLAQDIARLSEAARDGSATTDDLTGGTLTITSLGPLGGIATTPVINRPEVAIIGPNKIVERPVIVDGELQVRKMMNLSISCDHRVVDGYDAASFVQALKRVIEKPVLIFSD